MNALDVRNFITEHVGRHGRRSMLCVELERIDDDDAGLKFIETYEVKSFVSKEVDTGGPDVVLQLGRMIKSKRKIV
jgi:hypothetical protein